MADILVEGTCYTAQGVQEGTLPMSADESVKTSGYIGVGYLFFDAPLGQSNATMIIFR